MIKMNKTLITFLVISLLFMGSVSALDTSMNDQQYAQNQLFIKIDTTLTDITTLVSKESILYDYSSLVPGLYLIRISPDQTVTEALAYYQNQTGVIYAEPDYAVSIDPDPTQTPNNDTPQTPFPIIGILLGCGTALYLRRRN